MEPSLYRTIDGFLFELAVEATLAVPGAVKVNRGNWDYEVARGNRQAVVSMTEQGDKIGTEVSCWENGAWNKGATTWFVCTVPTSEIIAHIEGWLTGATVS
jgi:hypothetical protein